MQAILQYFKLLESIFGIATTLTNENIATLRYLKSS